MTTEEINLAVRLGFQTSMAVQEIGHDEDVDEELRKIITETTGTALVDEDYDGQADAVLLWFRDEDGDLTDTLMDAATSLDESGSVLLLTPKAGRDGYIEPSEINDAATTAGLSQTKSINAGRDWSGTRLLTPKAAKR